MKNAFVIARIGIVLAVMTSWHVGAAENITWPYDRLRHEADLILIAEAEKSEDTGELVNSSLLQIDFVGVNTTFKPLCIIDGRYREDALVVFHVRTPDGKTVPPEVHLAIFQTLPGQARTIDNTPSLGKVQYLLFLKKRKDGRFEPASGLLDSVYSVREIRSALTE